MSEHVDRAEKIVTLSMIKPDATQRNLTGDINARIEKAGLRIIAQKRLWLTKPQAEEFYAVHSERPFFEELTQYMSSGPVVAQVLEAEDAVNAYRKLMGATNPKEAEEGSLRKDFALSLTQNSVHGSDSRENALVEISFFFSRMELVG